MSADISKALERHPTVLSVSRQWVLAGLAGITLSLALISGGFFQYLPKSMAVLVDIGCGWMVFLIFSPWRNMQKLSVDQRPLIRELTARLRQITSDERHRPLKDLIIDRDDELGELSRTLHELAAEAFAHRSQARLLHQRMGHDIQRETRRATAHLQREAATDPLTGLGNRRTLNQRLASLAGPPAPRNRVLTVMAVDLDFFKQVNDALGHEIGDRCLVFLGDLLKSGLRREDCAIRLGGDEFVVLMPDQPLDVGKAVAGRLASLFAAMPWPHTTASRPTLSFGLACAKVSEIKDPADLLRQADVALYASKQGGRRAITSYDQCRRRDEIPALRRTALK